MNHRIGISMKLASIAAGIVIGIIVFQMFSELSTIATIDASRPDNTTIHKLRQTRLMVFVTLGTMITFTIGLQLFALKAVGHTGRLNEANLTNDQIRRQIRFAWYPMFINVICLGLISLLSVYNYGSSIAGKVLETQPFSVWSVELIHNVMLGFSFTSIAASICCALIDIGIVYHGRFPVERNNVI